MKVIMVILLCGWGEGAQCDMEPPQTVTLEYCRQQQALYRDINDHVQIKCIRQTDT